MKPIQWILLVVVLVVMVFAVTFVMQFLGGEGKTQDVKIGDNEPLTEILIVPETTYPTAMQGYVDQEKTLKYGDHDFPFSNPTEGSVTIGVNTISCTCVHVGILLASEEWKTRKAMLVASQFTGILTQPLLAPGFVAAEMRDPGLRDAEAKIQLAATLERSEDPKADYTLAPHAVGWIRLFWTGEQPGIENRSADVRMKQQKSRAVVRLEAHLRGVEPVQVLEQEYTDQNFSVAELQQKPKVFWFTVYSTTRPELHPKATLILPSNWKPEQAPFVVGKPQLVPPEQWPSVQEEFARLNQNPPKPPEQFQCVYRFPVTFHDRSVDQKQPAPFGLYRARIRVTFDEDKIDPMMCYVRGLLTGDVYVAGKDNRIELGSFLASQGSNEESVMLYSDVADLKLEIDREHTPAFLTAEVTPDETDKKAWKLTVRVEPNKVLGNFPRQDDGNYFDTGVYVKTVGDSSRSLRVPVIGNALQ